MIGRDDIAYHSERANAERARALETGCESAKRAHSELAALHAERVRLLQEEAAADSPVMAAIGVT